MTTKLFVTLRRILLGTRGGGGLPERTRHCNSGRGGWQEMHRLYFIRDMNLTSFIGIFYFLRNRLFVI